MDRLSNPILEFTVADKGNELFAFRCSSYINQHRSQKQDNYLYLIETYFHFFLTFLLLETHQIKRDLQVIFKIWCEEYSFKFYWKIDLLVKLRILFHRCKNQFSTTSKYHRKKHDHFNFNIYRLFFYALIKHSPHPLGKY